MAYLGKTPSQAVRQRYIYTASGSETSISGADDNGNTLTYTDGGYVDVYLNGVLLVAGTDYNTATANTISGLSALSASDVVEIVVYDVFSVFGGDVNGNLDVNGALSSNSLQMDVSTTGGIKFEENDGGAGVKVTTYQGTTNSNVRSINFHAQKFHVYTGVPQGTTTTQVLTVDSNGYLIVPNGITLGTAADTYSAANTLDDYEEGTWSPVMKDGSPSGTTITTAGITAFYTKVGRYVHLTLYIQRNDASSLTGTLYVIGLPFATESYPAVNGGAWFDNSSSDWKTFIYSPSANTAAYFPKPGNVDGNLATNNWQDGRYIYASFSYITNA